MHYYEIFKSNQKEGEFVFHGVLNDQEGNLFLDKDDVRRLYKSLARMKRRGDF